MKVLDKQKIKEAEAKVKHECKTLTGSLERLPNGDVFMVIRVNSPTGEFHQDLTGIVEFDDGTLLKNLPSYFTIDNAKVFTYDDKIRNI